MGSICLFDRIRVLIKTKKHFVIILALIEVDAKNM